MEGFRKTYFGYGAMAYPSVVGALLGRAPDRVGLDTRLRGYQLVTQQLDQVPDHIYREAPTKCSPRSMLRKVWPDSFRSYTIVRRGGGLVKGLVYEISERERQLILEWELVPWGWMHELTDLPVEGGGIFYCTTEGLRPGQTYDHSFTVEDDCPPPLLADLNAIITLATRVGEEFRSRQR